MQRARGTNHFTVAAADTVDTVWLFPHGNVKPSSLLTGFAFGTSILFNSEAVKREFIEYAVERTQRAYIPAKRAVYDDRRKYRNY